MTNNTPIILLLLSVGLFYTFTNDQYQEMKSLQTLVNEYQSVLENVSEIVTLRDNLILDYRAIPQAEISRIEKILPNNVDNVRLALDLDSMAARYGISIKNVQAVTTSKAEAGLVVLPEYAQSYEKATISFSFIASHENFMLLLADLEKNLRIMDIKSVSFQAGELNLYNYLISVETYWLK